MASGTTNKLTLPVGRRDHARGPANAPVTLVQYGDYLCPHCRQVHPILRELRKRLGNRFRYVHRHFPITTAHPNAQLAAEAAEAASAQGKFWEMHRHLYEEEGDLDLETLVRIAAQIGLDTDQFRQDLEQHTYAQRVQEDFFGGVRSGVNGTPTFFINGERYDRAWDINSLMAEIEKPLGVKIRLMFQRFADLQASGGILLLAATLLALGLANSALAHDFFEFWESHLTLSLGHLFELDRTLEEWVNDGLMVLFFFVVGLEIKREITVGELASARRAALPIMAAVGGMLVPAAFYLLFNQVGPGQPGWGVPMATDIAFTLGILTVLGSRVPLSLKVFFTALAIADDLGAVLVIAVFYSQGINWASLLVGAVVLLVLIGLNRVGVQRPLPYGLLGILLWLAFLESGVHPTIAGVLLALTIPASTRIQGEAFQAQCITVLGEFELEDMQDSKVGARGGRRQAAALALEAIAERIQPPAQRLEHSLTPWTTYVILPVFALANAGVALSGNLFAVLASPVALGIILGLVVGKPLGITAFSWLAVRLGMAELPAGVSWRALFSASCLAGIGFTMSLFIASAAFSDPTLLNAAKVSILAASVLAGVAGTGLMAINTTEQDSVTQYEPAAAD